MAAVAGRIFNVQRFSIHDGPGIRTTVFLKGCPLRCLWCHNPEGISYEQHLSFLQRNCILCRYCFQVCPHQVHAMDPERGHILLRERCDVCGLCTRECYAKALELVGRDVTVQEVLDEVLRDRPFYETSGGGMTLSGGEPLLQIDFAEALLQAAKEVGLHCAIETCGHVSFRRFRRVLPYVDLFFYDLKDMDARRHREYMGVTNTLILANLKALHDTGTAILVRLPVIPGLNDRPDHFEGVARLVATLPKLQGVEIMPYHRLGTGKRERMGLDTTTELHVETSRRETVSQWVDTLRDLGVLVVNEV